MFHFLINMLFFSKPKPVDNIFKKSMESEKAGTSHKETKKPQVGTKRKSALDDIMAFEEMKREKTNRKDHWLHKDIVVKVVTRRLGDKYYKKKAYVKVGLFMFCLGCLPKPYSSWIYMTVPLPITHQIHQSYGPCYNTCRISNM